MNHKASPKKTFLWVLTLEKRRTPLSDHLAEVFRPWVHDHLFSTGRNEEIFETFEVLAALAFLTLKTDKAELEHAIAQPGTYSYVSAPVGRSAWHSEIRDQIFAALEEPATRQAVLDAGFCKSDDDFLSMAIKSLRRVMGRISLF